MNNEWEKRFDDMFDVWKETDHGSKLENFPENHLNLAVKVKGFIKQTLTAQREQIIEELEGMRDDTCVHKLHEGLVHVCSKTRREDVLSDAIEKIKSSTT